MSDFFSHIKAITYAGADSSDPLSFRHYDKDRVVMGKRLEEHLRFAACYWHNFCWPGSDVFGEGTYDRPWMKGGDPLQEAKLKLDVAFDFFERLGVPYYCFHDRDLSPEGETPAQTRAWLDEMVDLAGQKMEQTGVKLLWGTANLFGHSRYMAGGATNPDPDVFAFAAAQVRQVLNATHQLGGENYVLWGGREGYDSLLNTDVKQEGDQLGRFLTLVAEHKHKIGYKGTLLIEPKPQEPTQHQYDYDTATVHAFLLRYGLEKEFKVNIEVNHATLAGHSFQHELAVANACDLFGSLDANRGDPQVGWDTDQFPNSVEEMTLACYEIIRGGGFTTGGFNFDTKLRRTSVDAADLFYGHIGGMDTVAKGFMNAAALHESQELQKRVDARYEGWQGELGQKMLSGAMDLDAIADKAVDEGLNPEHHSGQQELLENIVNRFIF